VVLDPSRQASAGQQTRRVTARPESEVPTQRPQSNWPWLKIAAAALILIVVGAAWDRHRRAVQPVAASIAAPAPQASEPAEAKAQQVSAPSAAKAEKRLQPQPPAIEPSEDKTPVRDAVAEPSIRDRPSRERGPRPGEAQDGQAGSTASREFQSADRNGDGFLSHDEVRGRFPVIDREFARVDANGDGRISPQEFWRVRQRQAEMKRDRPKY
jgi:hypothetical protein